MDTPVETPERRAFYDRIDKQNMTALWTVLGALDHARAQERLRAGAVALRARSAPPCWRRAS